MSPSKKIESVFHYAEVLIYVAIGILLLASSAILIYHEVVELLGVAQAESKIRWLIEIISKTLLLLMIIEIFYTVRVSLRDQVLTPEPFLIVGLIAAIRRILIISVETAYIPELFENHMIEISILGGIILIIVFSIILLKKYSSATTN